MSKGSETQYVWWYNEAMTQFGWIAFFAFVFPAAPMFSFITNFIEIKVKLQAMAKYSQRRIAEGAKGIGNWLPIMEIISMVCIPINCALIYWLGFKDKEPIFRKEFVEYDNERFAAGHKRLFSDDGETSNFNVFLFLVLAEHFLIIGKFALALVIPDVP